MTLKNKRGEPVELIFIAGSGRSGSTLLDRILGSSSNSISLGESGHLVKKLIHNRKINCSCTKSGSNCEFWSDIIRALKPKVEKFNDELKQSPGEGVFRIRHYIAQIIFNVQAKKQNKDYEQLLKFMYQSIANNTEARYMIDSTKRAIDLHCILNSGIAPVHVIHLIRDSRGVVYSWNKKPKEQPQHKGSSLNRAGITTSCISWAINNIITEMVIKKHGCKTQQILYHDLARSPQDTLNKLMRFISKQNDFKTPEIEGGYVSISKNHIISGNPNRFVNGKIEIKSDEAWKTRMNWFKKTWTTILTYPLLKHYNIK